MEKEIKLVTDINELSINEFEKLINIFSKQYETKIEEYVDIISVISNLDIDEIENLDIDEFKKLVTIANDIQIQNLNAELISEINIDGVTYKTNVKDNTYKFTVKEITLLQVLLVNQPSNYLADLIAIVFREIDSDGNLINDLSPEAIERRKEKLSTLKMKIIGPYFMSLTNFFLNKDVK